MPQGRAYESGAKRLMTGRLLTARVVAQQLGLSTETVLSWVRTGKLPAFKLPGGAIRFREDELDQWLEERATAKRGVSTPTPAAARTGRLSSVSSTLTEDEED